MRAVLARSLVAIGLAVAWSSAVSAQVALDATSHVSPEGAWVLHVDPDSREGDAGARYRMERDGEVVWECAHPFALWHASVAENGCVGGVAYPGGRLGGVLLVVVLDAEGNVVAEHATEHDAIPTSHGWDILRARCVVAQGGLDRLVVVLARGGDDVGKQRAWQVYRLSTGERLADVVPELVERALGSERLDAFFLRALPGTDLLLAQWRVYSVPGGSEDVVFVLHDADARTVWSLRCPVAETFDGRRVAEVLRGDVWHEGAILETDVDGGFEVWSPLDGVAVRFRAVRDDGAGWQVRRTGRRVHPPETREE